MRNSIRGHTLSVIFAFILCFSSQAAFSQTTAAQPQEQAVPAESQFDPQAHELYQKKMRLLQMINSVEDPAELRKLYDFFTVQYEIMAHYVDEKSFSEVLELGMIGMVESLDPYSHLFIDQAAEELYKDFNKEENYTGAGMVVMSLHKNIYVVEVFDSSPAAKAGIQQGDVILKVDGKDVYGFNTNQVVQLIGGKEGTSVIVEIKSPRLQKPKTLTLIRRHIVVESVSYKELRGGIVYAKIRTFSPDEKVVERFRDVLNKTAGRKLIIDLRGNGGGSLNAVNKMVGFLTGPNKTLISVKGREGESFVMTPPEEDANPPKLPSKIVVLVNNYSASASEIMAGNLKHYKLADLVGIRTYGKAVVQNYYGLDMPSHQLKGSRLIMGITIERYYLPDGTNITGNGVRPDVEVEQPDDFKPFEYLTKRDLQFQEALKLLRK